MGLMDSPVSQLTGNVEENKSLYWHPAVYKYNPKTGKHTRDKMSHTSAYYIWETGQVTAFPAGFQMIGGFDVDKSKANAECVNPSPCDSGDCQSGNNFFPTTKCDELEVSMRMPNCWDGVSVNSPETDHQGHVAYGEDSWFDGDCPASHPVKLPQIQLFFRIAPYDGGWHEFADGSGVYHADYVSGWDVSFLQNVLDNCQNDGEGAMPNNFCEQFLTYRDGPKCTDENTCDFSDPALLEKVKAFQPDPLDVKGTIIAEETKNLSNGLPRGTCNGSLVGGGGGPAPTPTKASVPAPTKAPVPSPTPAPVPAPTGGKPMCVDHTNKIKITNKKGTKTNMVKCNKVSRKKCHWLTEDGQKLFKTCPVRCEPKISEKNQAKLWCVHEG